MCVACNPAETYIMPPKKIFKLDISQKKLSFYLELSTSDKDSNDADPSCDVQDVHWRQVQRSDSGCDIDVTVMNFCTHAQLINDYSHN